MKKQQFDTGSTPALPETYGEHNDMLIKHRDNQIEIVMNIMPYPDAIIKTAYRAGEDDAIVAIKLYTSNGASITISIESILGRPADLDEELAKQRLFLTKKALVTFNEFCRALLNNIDSYFPNEEFIANQTGFVGQRLAFAFHDSVVQKSSGKTVILPPKVDRQIADAGKPFGDYTKYRDAVLSSDAPLIVKFVIMYALSSMLLDFVDVESGGMHFYGASGSGKTTLLRIAASVFGRATAPDRNLRGRSYLHHFDTTSNALDTLFPLFNNMLLGVDEIGKLSVRELSPLIYKIGSGVSKMRANTSIELVENEPSRYFVMTTGEVSIPQYLKQTNESNQAKGKSVRLPSIVVKPEYLQRIGCNTVNNSKEYVHNINKAITNSYGHLSRDFINKTFDSVNDYDELAAQVSKCFDEKFYDLTESLEPKNSIEDRWLHRLALVQIAGEMASDLDVLPWSHDQIDDAIKFIHKYWKSEDSNTMDDAEAGVKNIINFIKRNAHCFLDAENDDIWGKSDIIGYEKGNYFYILPERFERLCGTAHIDDVLRHLTLKGLIRSDKGKRVKRAELKAVGKRAYYYVLSRDVLSEI